MLIAAWIASALVFISFFTKTIVPLRRIAIASNVAFIIYALMAINYGIFDKVLPIMVLHVALLALNILRLREIQKTIHAVQTMTRADASLDALVPYMKHERMKRGEWLFKKGDAADRLYVLKKGRIRLVEFEKTLEAGAVFGEVGIFSDSEMRTSSALSEDDCELYSLTSDKAVELFYQDPRFGFYIVRALARYVSEGIDQALPPIGKNGILPDGSIDNGLATVRT